MNIYEAKTQLSKLVARAEAGERIVIARNGRPVAELGPAGGITVKRELGSSTRTFCCGRLAHPSV